MKRLFTKKEWRNFLNELTVVKNRYRPVEEEAVPKGYYSSSEMALKYKKNHRVCQRLINEHLKQGKLSVIWARRKSGIAIRKVPCYKFKKKSYEKSFQSRPKRKF
jgi:hypothetical protein